MLTLLVALALATLGSEDLACVGAGAFVAEGHLGFVEASIACAAGIFAGDVLLYLVGRLLGRRALRAAPFRWFVSEAAVERSSRWLDARGATVVFASRFVPGTRLPTYFAAGSLGTSAPRFVLLFLAATAVWTPLLVGASAFLGTMALHMVLKASEHAGVAIVVSAVVVLVAARVALAVASPRGRALASARLARLRRWEFWPPWVFYPPVVAYVAWLAVRHRSATVFTAANPAIADGGFVGESKSAILDGLASSPDRVATWTLVRGSLPLDERVARVAAFRAEHALDLPIVLKPDVGQRGSGVAIVRSESGIAEYLAAHTADVIAQAYVPGVEFGVFYVREPGRGRGRIFSVTEKRFPAVCGDGRRTLEWLILGDPRARLASATHFAAHAARLDAVPSVGERVPLVEIGSHCRGALFLDGSRIRTPELEAAIDEVSRGFDGFFFGRFDIRAESAEALARGEGFRIVELNGVTSEATHIYDPANGLFDAYRVVFEQWRLAFAIGAANRDRGVRPTPPFELARRVARAAVAS